MARRTESPGDGAGLVLGMVNDVDQHVDHLGHVERQRDWREALGWSQRPLVATAHTRSAGVVCCHPALLGASTPRRNFSAHRTAVGLER